MSEQTLEARVAAVEKTLTELRERVAAMAPVQTPPGKWWERHRPSMTAEEEQDWFAAAEYGRYFRKTGREAPPDWKPGDPIPEPAE